MKEVREFLFALAPYLKGESHQLLMTFVTRFTHSNLIRWDEAMRIMGMVLSPLKDLALTRLYEVDLSYIKQQAPPLHYAFLCNAQYVRVSATKYKTLGEKKETPIVRRKDSIVDIILATIRTFMPW